MPISLCTSPMMNDTQNYSFCRLQLVFELNCLDTQLNQPTNQSPQSFKANENKKTLLYKFGDLYNKEPYVSSLLCFFYVGVLISRAALKKGHELILLIK